MWVCVCVGRVFICPFFHLCFHSFVHDHAPFLQSSAGVSVCVSGASVCLRMVGQGKNCDIPCPCHHMPKLIYHDLAMRPKVGSHQCGSPSVHGPGHLLSVQLGWVRQDGQQPLKGVRRGFQEGWGLDV